MSKIKSIQINNFKFFTESAPIELDGKHLLLYGENGSGKSSFCYALYTLLEAASKTPDEVKRYFADSNASEESLLNIYADNSHGPEHTGAFIKVVDTQGKSYQLDYNNTTICGDALLLESQRASDYIDYKSLFRFQLFRNSQEVNLKEIFEHSVLPYVSFNSFTFKGHIVSNALGMWLEYKEGPEKILNRRGREILVYKRSPEYQNYVALERHFNREMLRMVTYINSNITSVLERLGYNFKPKLEYIPTSHVKKDKWVAFTDYKLLLTITEYEGVLINLAHPNTFLNEAKMAALAFAMRWAMLSYRFESESFPNAMRVLVLDDLMISLDMGNRERLLPIILNELASDFQILFVTHDRSLYESVRKMIGSDNPEWKVKEMFDVCRNNIHFPVIQDANAKITKALNYFNGAGCSIDYCACGNTLRQAIEEVLMKLLRYIDARIEGIPVKSKPSPLMLKDMISIATQEFPRHQFSLEPITKLDSLRAFTLNPTSHYSPTSNFYRIELLDAFDVYEQLCAYQVKVLVPKDSELKITFYSPTHGDCVFILRTLTSICAYKDYNNEQFVLSNVDSYRMNAMSYNGSECKRQYKGTLVDIYHSLVAGLESSSVIDSVDRSGELQKVIEYNGQSLELLM